MTSQPADDLPMGQSPSVAQWLGARNQTKCEMCSLAREASGTAASEHRKLRTRLDLSISRRQWHKFCADIRKERMATSSRRELDGFLTSATHSKRCTEQGIEVDSTVLEKLIKQWMGHLQNLMD